MDHHSRNYLYAPFFVGMFFFWQSSDSVVSWISSKMSIENWLQKQSNEWLSFLFLMTGMMLRLVLVLFYFSLFKYLILIIGSPLFAYLSEKTEAIIENKAYSFNWAAVKRLQQEYKTRPAELRLAIGLPVRFTALITGAGDRVDYTGHCSPGRMLLLRFFHAGL